MGAGNFKNQGQRTLQNSTFLILTLQWHLSTEDRKKAVSEDERKKIRKNDVEEEKSELKRASHFIFFFCQSSNLNDACVVSLRGF